MWRRASRARRVAAAGQSARCRRLREPSPARPLPARRRRRRLCSEVRAADQAPTRDPPPPPRPPPHPRPPPGCRTYPRDAVRLWHVPNGWSDAYTCVLPNASSAALPPGMIERPPPAEAHCTGWRQALERLGATGAILIGLGVAAARLHGSNRARAAQRWLAALACVAAAFLVVRLARLGAHVAASACTQ